MTEEKKDSKLDRSEDDMQDIPTFSVTTPTGDKVEFYRLSALIKTNGKRRRRRRNATRSRRERTGDIGSVSGEDVAGNSSQGNHEATRAGLMIPLEISRGIMHGFCSGCGTYFDVSRSELAQFLNCTESALPEDLCGLFLEVGVCKRCDSDVISAQLKRIDLAKMP